MKHREASNQVKGLAINNTIKEIGLLAHLLDTEPFPLIAPINTWLIEAMTEIHEKVSGTETMWTAIAAFQATVNMLKHDELYSMEDDKLIKLSFAEVTIKEVLEAASLIFKASIAKIK